MILHLFNLAKTCRLQLKKLVKNIKKWERLSLPKRNIKYREIVGEIVKVEDVKTDQRVIKVPASIEKPKRSGKEAAKNIIKKYNKIRREKKFKKIVEAKEKKKKKKNINILEEVTNFNDKKNARITAQKILQKYKRMQILK